MKHRIFTLFCLVAFLISCSPKYSNVYLTPEQGFYDESDHREIVKLDFEGVAMESDFLQATQYDLLFDLKIANNSDEELTISPSDFSYMAYNNEGQNFAKEYAFDPENLLFEIDESIARDKAAAKTENTLSWIFFGVEALAAVVGFATDDDNAPLYAIDAGINLAATQAGTAQMKKHIVYLESERDYYENSALRDTILSPGSEIQGIIIYPRLDQAKQMLFQYDLNGRLFELAYSQTRYK
jgi:hypothetical protein